MENPLYIRIRGRVLGPYDKDKLQAMARRGQLSRLHELSADGTNWVRASTYPELFMVDGGPRGAVAAEAAAEACAAAVLEAQPPTAALRRWWYRKNGAEAGPVEEAALQQMVASGFLLADDMVWTEGMPQWAPARGAPGLAVPTDSVPRYSQGGPAGLPQRDELPATLCRAAGHTRSWVMFIAVGCFVFAALAVVIGIWLLILGADRHQPPTVVWGFFGLILGADLAVGGCLLSTYASRLAGLRHSGHPIVLEKSLDTLRGFWIYTSINLIVFFAFFLIVIVWWIAVARTVPWIQ